jgi:hypothetical protein
MFNKLPAPLSPTASSSSVVSSALSPRSVPTHAYFPKASAPFNAFAKPPVINSPSTGAGAGDIPFDKNVAIFFIVLFAMTILHSFGFENVYGYEQAMIESGPPHALRAAIDGIPCLLIL